MIITFNYRRALQKAKTVAECQRIYDHQVDLKLAEYRQKYPDDYEALLAAEDVTTWISAENRAKQLRSLTHNYGELIRRRY